MQGERQLGSVEQTLEKPLIPPNCDQFGEHALIEFERVLRGEVAQAIVLQPAPERFDCSPGHHSLSPARGGIVKPGA
jgi:hypothetical protein